MAQADYTAAILADNPKAYYKMDDASGNPHDYSGHGWDGNGNTGTITYQQPGPFIGSSSIKLSSNGADLQVSTSLTGATDNCSIEFWSNITTNSEGNAWGMGALAGWYCQIWGNTGSSPSNQIQLIRGSGQILSTAGSNPDNTWVFWACVMSGHWTYYKNGQVDTPDAGGNNTGPGGNPFRIAQFNSASGSCSYSNMAFYETALTANQVLNHYNEALLLPPQSVVARGHLGTW